MTLRSINDWLAIRCTTGVATMACVWVFLAWSLLPVVWPSSETTVFYVSGGVLQLVLLPLIMVGQSKLSEASDKRQQEMYEDIVEILADVREEQAARHAEVMAEVKE